MPWMSATPSRGLLLSFVVLTLGALAVAVVAGIKGIWLLVVVAAFFAVCNVGILWALRASGTPQARKNA